MENKKEIQNELERIAPGLLPFGTEMPYFIPDKYFELLAENILSRLSLNELRGYAIGLNNLSKKNVYQVPSEYFETLADNILEHIKKQQKFIPKEYFNELPDIMLAKVREIDVSNELDEIAPILNTISKEPAYFIPKDYFEKKHITVPSTFEKYRSSIKEKNWIKIAAAACMVGVSVFFTLKFFNKIDREGMAIHSKAYFKSNVNIDDSLSKIDAPSMEEYLKTEELIADAGIAKFNPVRDEEIDGFLKEFSDEELKKYLMENGEIINN